MSNFGKRGAYPGWSDAELTRMTELFPRAPWNDLLGALPTRTRAAIWQMGANVLKLKREINRKEKWTTDELVILKRIYPTASDGDLEIAFPRHSFIAIQRQASAIKIDRPRPEARHHKRFVHPICVKFYEERRRQRLKRNELSKKIGYAYGQILGWELGKTTPDLAAITAWGQGLGFEIVARKPESPDAIIIPYPDKKKLMGGRA